MSGNPDVAEASQHLFDTGYYCAESVLLGIARERGIESPLIPAIATGLCSGMARTSGMCGALSGGILALNLVHGRHRPEQSVEQNYSAVQALISDFSTRCGTTGCSQLLGCDLGTEAGQQTFRTQGLISRCREYVGIAAGLVMQRAD